MKFSRPFIFIKAIVFTAILVLLVNAFAFTSFIIPSDSSMSALSKDDRVIVNRWSYGLRLPFTTERIFENQVKRGDIVIFNSPNPPKQNTAIFNRSLLIDRCVGIPGDTLMLNSDFVITNNHLNNIDKRTLYVYPQSKEDYVDSKLCSLGIVNKLAGYKDSLFVRSLNHDEITLLKNKMKNDFCLVPLYSGKEITHPFIVPAKGRKLTVTPWNMTLLCNTIRNHENQVAVIIKEQLYVNGAPIKSYTFTQDYYWMASDDPMNLNDSRMYGFVPQSHLIGKASFVWFTSNRDHFLQRIE